MDMTLHAIQDDFNLRADADTERGSNVAFPYSYYLTDPSGNYLTDPSGNRLIAYYNDLISPQQLHSVQDDFKLHAE